MSSYLKKLPLRGSSALVGWREGGSFLSPSCRGSDCVANNEECMCSDRIPRFAHILAVEMDAAGTQAHGSRSPPPYRSMNDLFCVAPVTLTTPARHFSSRSSPCYAVPSSASVSPGDLCDSSSTLCLSSLSSSTSHPFENFTGSCAEFKSCVSCGRVVILFSKPSCSPCAMIWQKLMRVCALRRRLDTMSNSSARSEKGEDTHGKETRGKSGKDATCTADVCDKCATDDWATEKETSCGPSRHHYESHEECSSDSRHTCHGGGRARVAAAAVAVGCHTDNLSHTAQPSHASVSSKVRHEPWTDSHKRGLDDMPAWLVQHIHFVVVDTTVNDYLTSLHDVRCVPTFVAYNGGQIIGRVEGAHEQEFQALLRLYH